MIPSDSTARDDCTSYDLQLASYPFSVSECDLVIS